MRRRLVALTVVPLMLLGTAACGESSSEDPTDSATAVDTGEDISGVEVSGEFGSEPEVTIDAPLELQKTTSEVVTVGDGNPVVAGEQALLHLYVANGTSGEKAATTYDQDQPVALAMSEDQIFPSVLDAIVDKPVGSRVVIAAQPKDAYGETGAPQLQLTKDDNVVFVVDIMSVEPTEVLEGPEGEDATDVPQSLPNVETENGDVTGIGFADAPEKPAGELEVITLVEGEGPPAREASLVTFDYFGQIYGTEKVFDESFSKDPVTFPLGVGGLIEGWDEGLVGAKRGSRLMIIAPPQYGYGETGNPSAGIKGTDTLVFVVDILGVDEKS